MSVVDRGPGPEEMISGGLHLTIGESGYPRPGVMETHELRNLRSVEAAGPVIELARVPRSFPINESDEVYGFDEGKRVEKAADVGGCDPKRSVIAQVCRNCREDLCGVRNIGEGAESLSSEFGDFSGLTGRAGDNDCDCKHHEGELCRTGPL